MSSVNLAKMLRKGEVLSLLRGLVSTPFASITISDSTGNILIDDLGINGAVLTSESMPQEQVEANAQAISKIPILVDGEIIGWVSGQQKVQEVANLLNYLSDREFEQKSLAAEALDKYREISLLYTISSKLCDCLDLQEISKLVIEEASRLIHCTSASVMLYDEASDSLNIIAAKGTASSATRNSFPINESIAGHVFKSGIPELVNDVTKDHRYFHTSHNCYAIICAPIITKQKILGVVNISNSELVAYTSQDLKLFNAIVTQAAGTMENSILHDNKLREEKIKNNLERYLSPQVAQAVINAKEEISLTTRKQKIAMLFSDIRNFTTKCEELDPEQLVAYLNEYFTEMVDVIFTHKGTVNKFVGDMIVAMFGAPEEITDREYWAIESAISMQNRLKNLPIAWIRDNFNTGIGISSGDVIVGNIGSPQHMDYTAIGDEMNIASRLQGLAHGGQILVTRSVYEATQAKFQFKEFGTLPVKGKKNLVEIFEVIY